MLFAVTIASIILAITLGVINIAYKEIKFTTETKDTDNAFFAADTAIEYALFKDKQPNSIYIPAAGTKQTWNFVVTGLGSDANSCAKVSVIKDNTVQPFTTTSVSSKGYNIGDINCESTNNSRIERELKLTY